MEFFALLLSCKDVHTEAEPEFWKYLVINFPFCHAKLERPDGSFFEPPALRFEKLGLPSLIPGLCETLIQKIARHSNEHKENSLGITELTLQSEHVRLYCKLP